MTGAVGFIIGALCIAGFAATAARAYTAVPPRKLQLFTLAFGLLSAAMLVWAATVLLNNPQSTKELIFASDFLLLLGTGCMIQLLFSRSDTILTILLAVAGSLVISLRAFVYTPTAYVSGGLLQFNLTSSVRDVIIGAFLLLWLPAVIVVSSYIAKDKSLPGVQGILSLAFMTLIAVTALFLSARRSAAIIGLFAVIAAIFLAMTAVNIIIMKLHKSYGAKNATGPAR